MDLHTYDAIARLTERIARLDRELAELKSQLGWATAIYAGSPPATVSVITDDEEWTERLIGEGWQVRNNP